MLFSRRDFLAGCAAMVAAYPASRVRATFAASSEERDLFVMLFLRGGCDGLNLVAPVDDPAYRAARGPELRVVDSGEEPGLPLSNGFSGFDFRIHPLAAPLKELYDDGRLAIVHACGLTHGTRSHFQAMNLIERGAPEAKHGSISTGWLARHLGVTGAVDPISAVAATPDLPDSLLGSHQAAAIARIDEFGVGEAKEFLDTLRWLHRGESAAHHAGVQTLRVTGAKVRATFHFRDSQGFRILIRSGHGRMFTRY